MKYCFLVCLLVVSASPTLSMTPSKKENAAFLKASLESRSLSEFMELYRQAVGDKEQEEQLVTHEIPEQKKNSDNPTMLSLLEKCILHE